MSTPKKVKMSDEPVPAEPDSQVFQALDQVQQKLDQVCVYTSLQRRSGCAMSIGYYARPPERTASWLALLADH